MKIGNVATTRAVSGGLLALLTILIGVLTCAKPAFSQEGEDNPSQWDTLPEYERTLNDSPLEITEAGSYRLSGTSSAPVVVNTEGNIRLILDGVNITSATGAAIIVENADNTRIQLASGTTNYLEDSATRVDASINAVIDSADDLRIEGEGKLVIQANYEDGIASRDDIKIVGGDIEIISADDGIRGNDSVEIEGGNISIAALGDGIKTSNNTDVEKGYIHISGGNISIESGDDAIKGISRIVVDGGNINISRSVEGMEALFITINDGDIRLVASDDGINATYSGYREEIFGGAYVDPHIEINGGKLDVTVGSGDTDAVDANGSILITGGEINITAPTSSFDADRGAQMTGGTLTVNGQQMTSIPASRRGGGGRPRGG